MACVAGELVSSASDLDATLAADLDLLRAFAAAPSAAPSPTQQVAVVTAVARAPPASHAHVAAARDALAALAPVASADRAVLGPLLRVADAGRSVARLPEFVLASAAWKTVAAAVARTSRDCVFDQELQTRILLCAAAAAAQVLKELELLFSKKANDDGNGTLQKEHMGGEDGRGFREDEDTDPEAGAAAARYIKILRFQCINAARFAKAFLDRGTRLEARDPCVSSMLRALAALLSTSVITTGHLPVNVVDGLREHVTPPAAASARAVLAMCACPEQVSDALHAAYLLQHELDSIDQDAVAARLVAISYFIRIAGADDGRAEDLSFNGKRQPQPTCAESAALSDANSIEQVRVSGVQDLSKSERCSPDISGAANGLMRFSSHSPARVSALLRHSAGTALLPLLFNILSHIRPTVFDVLLRGNPKCTLVDLAVSAAVDCTVLADTSSASRSGSCATRTTTVERPLTPLALRMFLFEHVASRNSIVAFVAEEAIVALARYYKNCVPKLSSLYIYAMGLTRLAVGADVVCAETRWVPLSARIGEIMHRSRALQACHLFRLMPCDRNLPTVLQSSVDSSMQSWPDFKVLCSIEGIRVLAAIMTRLDVSYVRKERARKNSVDANKCSTVLLNQLGVSVSLLSSFILKVLADEPGDRITEACAHLLPYVCDAHAVSGAALAVIKRSTSSSIAVTLVINALDPAVLPETSLRSIATEFPRLLERHGPAIYPPLMGLIGRIVRCLHRTVSLSTWNEWAPITDAALRWLCSDNNSRKQPLAAAAVSLHSSTILHVMKFVHHQNAHGQTHVSLPRFALEAAERALERVEAYSSHVSGRRPAEHRHLACVEWETASEMSLELRSSSSNPGRSTVTDVFTTMTALRRAIIAGVSGNPAVVSAGLQAEIDALMSLVPMLGALLASMPAEDPCRGVIQL